MSDSQAVTIPAAEHEAAAETRPARLLKALAQHPEPLSAPALASLLAEPSQGRRLLISCASALRRLEHAATRNERAAPLEDAADPPLSGASPPQAAAGSTNTTQHEALAAAAAAQAQRQAEQAQRTATKRDHALDEARAGLQPPDSADHPQTSRPPAKDLGCTLDQIGAVFHVSRERFRQDLLWNPAARKA